MEMTAKIIIGVGLSYGAYLLLRMGGKQKAERDERADRRVRRDQADAKATARSIKQRR